MREKDAVVKENGELKKQVRQLLKYVRLLEKQ